MNRHQFIGGAALCAAAGLWIGGAFASCVTDVAAYVWPAYQNEPRWAELGIFGAGKGEWQNVWEAVPKWKGHSQPLAPTWGYEDESDPKVVERKIDAAVAHGVNVFIYDWYWYGGRPFLENGLNRGFLGAKNNGKMKFFVMWANHHVNWLWDNKAADKRWSAPREDWLGYVTDGEFRTKLVPRWIEQYFTRPNYYRIGGKPVLMIYEVGTFIQGVGGVEKASAAIAYLRAEAAKAGLGGVHLMACDYGLKAEWVKALGIDSATIYNFIHWASAKDNPDYADWAKKGAARFDVARRELGLAAYFPHVSVGWDTNPRYPAGSVQPTVLGSTPAKFEVALRRAKVWGEANVPKGMPKLITVNSWNEWTEGSYLEPDTVNGFGYLDAIRRVAGLTLCGEVSVRLDISGEAARQTVIAEGGRTLPDGYQGRPTTVLTREGKLICVWTFGHGGPCGPAAESTDGGRTWTRIDDRFPKVYRETHKNCPTLQKCVCRDGHERLFVFSAKRRDPTKIKGGFEQFSWNAPLGIMISDDGGRTWREGTPAEMCSNMPPTGFMQLKDGSLALFGQVRLDAKVKTDGPKDDQGVWMSVSRDDGETWSPMRIVAETKERNLCEPFCLRSPDGKTLALLIRENRHTDCSMMCFSSDEGQTWTKPVLTAPELTGDRHEGILLDDGRYLICFRDQMKKSPTAGQYVGWVGSWDDIVNARPGDLRIRLLNHHGKHGVWPGNEWDTGCSGVEKFADGTILCTTSTRHFDDDRHSSVVATRLYPSDFNNAMNSDADITAFGARTDAAPAANAAAIQKAIDAAERSADTSLDRASPISVPSPSAPAYLRAAPPSTPPESRLWQGISPKVKAWEMGGRAETLKWFEEHQFGRTPARAREIAAKEAQFEKSAVVFPKAKLRINIFCARPKGADAAHPAPVFLFMDHRGGQTLDRPQEEYANIPTNAITARGYAYVRWNGNDLCPNTDRWHGLGHWPVGIVSYVATGDASSTNLTRAADGWGTIGAWAWGSSRVLDWIARQPELDATRVCVIGHSRGGKTALWTAAQDERFAMAISSGSGCGGAGLARERTRYPKAEKIGDILKNFPNWFCPAFHEWIGRDAELPHDADDLIRLIAPRLVYIVSGSEDAWAGPNTEKAAWDAAHDLYDAYGLADRMGYYCHDGGHFLRPDDWEQVMNLADRALKVPSAADSDEIDRRLAAAVADGSRTVTLGRNPAAKDGVWRLVRAILVPDDFTLVFDGCRVELADRVQDNIIRNAGAADGDGVAKPSKDIRILGRNGAKLSAGERNHYRPRRSGDPNGWRAFGILLRNVSDYEIGGLAFGETQCWAITQERCHHGRVHDLVFGSTDRFYNQDGIDVRKGCHDLLIENISGSTGDDAVALTALRADASCGEADDIYNVTVCNVRAKSAGGHGVIRLLNADGIRMHHIAVSNVVDTASGSDKRPQATIRIGDANFSTIRRCKMGEMHHVTVRDVKASGPLAVSIYGPLCDSSVTDITPTPGGRRYDITAPLERVDLDR